MYLIKQKQGSSFTTFWGTSTYLLCYLKWATGLEDFCTHILLSHFLSGVISAYNTVVANSLRYRLSWEPRSYPTNLCTHTAQACLASTMPFCGLHYTGDITITATTVYTWLLLKNYSVEDLVLFSTCFFLFCPACSFYISGTDIWSFLLRGPF